MPKRENPQTSIDAYRNLDPTRLAEIYTKIVAALNVIGEGTFEDIADQMRVKPEKVWKRLSELKRADLIHRTNTRRVLKSGDTGFTWKAGPNPGIQSEKLMPGKSVSDFSKELIDKL